MVLVYPGLADGFHDLIDAFGTKRVEWHEGGYVESLLPLLHASPADQSSYVTSHSHNFPTKPSWTKFISAYLQSGLDPARRDTLAGPGGRCYHRERWPPLPPSRASLDTIRDLPIESSVPETITEGVEVAGVPYEGDAKAEPDNESGVSWAPIHLISGHSPVEDVRSEKTDEQLESTFSVRLGAPMERQRPLKAGWKLSAGTWWNAHVEAKLKRENRAGKVAVFPL